MTKVQWKFLAGLATAGCTLVSACLPAGAASRTPQTAPFSLIVPAAQIDTDRKCITVGDQEFCLVNKKKSGAPNGQAPGGPAPQGGNAPPPGGVPGQAGGGGNGAPPANNAGGAPNNAGMPPAGNAGVPAGADANANLEPGEHVCPVGYLVLATKSKFGAFCEEVKGFSVPTGMETVERACPAGTIVLATPNKYKALCEPKEGFAGTASAPKPICCAGTVSSGGEIQQCAATEAEARSSVAAYAQTTNLQVTSTRCFPQP